MADGDEGSSAMEGEVAEGVAKIEEEEEPMSREGEKAGMPFGARLARAASLPIRATGEERELGLSSRPRSDAHEWPCTRSK
jgi:hypothetical protein